MKKRTLLTAALSVSFLTLGCANKRTANLKPQDFSQPQPKVQPAPAVATTQPVPAPAKQEPPKNDIPAAANPTDNTSSATPTVRPANAAPYSSKGAFMILGTVVGEANGQPIYADKVLAKIDAVLATKAQTLAPREYRLVAQDLIERQIMEDITNELEFAAAQRNLSEEDQQIATAITTQYRTKEITKAGGSLAIARARAAEDGIDFDEKLKDEYRRNMIRIYYVKRVFPKVQISAEDMRRFYDKNVDELYSEKSGVRFRVIFVGIKERGSAEDAFDRAKRAHEKATRGDDFGRLAVDYNDNPTYRKNRGYRDVRKDDKGQTILDETNEPIGALMSKGSLKLKELEDAIFALQPGQITPIIRGEDGFYFAKLEEKKTGRVRAFEEEFVQLDIHDRMTKEQRAELRKKEQKKLLDAAVTRTDDKMILTAIEMAMQKYVLWTKSSDRTPF